MNEALLYHYTDRNGYNGITADRPWRFAANDQHHKSANPRGAYFVTLAPTAKNLGRKLRIGPAKRAYFLSFLDLGDLHPLNSDRGRDCSYIFYSPEDYLVAEDRHREHGENPEWR